MHYEVICRGYDELSERIIKLLLDRGLPFAQIELMEKDAKAMELKTGRALPLVVQDGTVIGGYSDLVNSLRRPKRSAVQPVLAY